MTLLLALGLVCVIEGLVLALAPFHMERLLAALAELSRDQRRMIGLIAVAVGAALIAVARALGA